MPLAERREDVLTGMMRGEQNLRQRYAQRRNGLYGGERPILVGHLNIGGGTAPHMRGDGRLIGLDTTCYAGGALSSVLPAELRMLQCRAEAATCRR